MPRKKKNAPDHWTDIAVRYRREMDDPESFAGIAARRAYNLFAIDIRTLKDEGLFELLNDFDFRLISNDETWRTVLPDFDKRLATIWKRYTGQTITRLT